MGAKKALIFGSMECPDWTFLQPYLDWPDLVIAADGGVHCAKAAGFQPKVYIGDSDSGGRAENGMECVPLKPEKDVTDLQAAYDWAKEHGYRELIFTACTGGRQDHHLSAIQLLETAGLEGISARILDPYNEIEYLTPGTYRLEKTAYYYFSLIPVDPVLQGVTIRGAKYPLEHRRVRRGDSLTVSNEWKEPVVEIDIKDGCCYLIRANNRN